MDILQLRQTSFIIKSEMSVEELRVWVKMLDQLWDDNLDNYEDDEVVYISKLRKDFKISLRVHEQSELAYEDIAKTHGLKDVTVSIVENHNEQN